jgi:hypothetical protein
VILLGPFDQDLTGDDERERVLTVMLGFRRVAGEVAARQWTQATFWSFPRLGNKRTRSGGSR